MNPEPRLRPLRAEESDLLFEASMGTINWPGPRFTEAEARAIPEIAHYWDFRPERGDLGVVAETAGAGGIPLVVGVTWLLFFPEDDPGYGFVAADVPEYGVWVREGWRGAGLGRRLTEAVIAEARARGLRAISLSVEDSNPSHHLYRSLGWEPVPGGEADGVMLLPLDG
ncbi:GNAT family N-acetyltransferase [Ornithinimicrobium flavum]|uniref:GNAT family N-acetyltransferase n=1 Tax=Ornithinimicrobium flavum TaxID=1288636 RepID=UPI001EE78386|nr:GNAT family N-acetyltransferase [Ornithinimicrobium flavum]